MSDQEYNNCVNRAFKVYDDMRTAKTVCGLFNKKMLQCKTVCDSEDSSKTQEVFKKCVNTVKNDAELDACIKQNAAESSIKLCKLKCELVAIENYKSV